MLSEATATVNAPDDRAAAQSHDDRRAADASRLVLAADVPALDPRNRQPLRPSPAGLAATIAIDLLQVRAC